MPGPRRQGRRALRAGTRFSGSSLDTPCSLLKFLVWMREKSSSSPFGGMLKSSFRQISSYLIVISRKKSSPLRAKTQAVADRAHAKLVLARIVRLQRAYQALRAVSNRYIWVSLAILAVKPMPQLLVAVFLIVRETISVLRSRSLQSLTQTLLRIEIAAPKFNQNTPASS